MNSVLESKPITEHFNFYGLTIAVSSASTELVEEVRRDFTYFRVPVREGQVRVEMRLAAPPYGELPPLPASIITPRNVCFQNAKITYIDYFGQGLAAFERKARRCVIYGTEPDLVHEIAYLFVLSTVGQHLDRRGIHRVHALGVSYHNRGILLLLPSGGGKSTMALELMRRPGFFLLGEDTPLIDRRGRILPFPLRLGVQPKQETGIPPEHLRTVRRMEFDPKTPIDIDYFKDRLSGEVEPGLILVGERNLGDVSEIVPLARHRAFKALVKYVIVGLGVYQGMEFLLEWQQIIGPELRRHARGLSNRVLDHLRLLAGDTAGFPVDRLQHSLQTATLAHQAGEDEEEAFEPMVRRLFETPRHTIYCPRWSSRASGAIFSAAARAARGLLRAKPGLRRGSADLPGGVRPRRVL